jgi:phosphomannomutase
MKTLILFDVDGTLTVPRNKINNDMIESLKKLYENDKIEIGFVGGSDLNKQIEQIGLENMYLFKWKFTENGLKSYERIDDNYLKDKLIHSKNIVSQIGEEEYQKLINAILKTLSELNLPKKRGNFIELRNGMINVSPIGRNCTQEERDEFEKYDLKNNVRNLMIEKIKTLIGKISNNITFSIGGQISVDIFPRGWDKTYCLQFVQYKYDKIYFFGDKTMKGGNDYEIYNDSRVNGYKVETYNDTIKYINEIFL